jgi:hypothetical protein
VDCDCEGELVGGFAGAVLCAQTNAVGSEVAMAATINDFEGFIASPGSDEL